MADFRNDPTDPRNDRTRNWSRTQIGLLIAGIVIGFILAGGVYFLMAGMPKDNTRAPATGALTPPALLRAA